jgi:MFS family permease
MAGLFIPVGVLVAAPLGGWLLDRFGARRVAMAGLAAFAASVAGFSLVTRDPWSFYIAMLVLTVAAAGVLPTTWTRIINGAFDRQRGLALGIALSGSGVFATFGPTLAQTMIDTVGWRTAWLVLAALPLLIALPLVAAFVHTRVETPASKPAAIAPGLAPRVVMRSRRFWTMIVSYGLVSLALGGFNANLVPILASEGLAMSEAAGVAGTLGLSLIVGRLVAGALIDRFPSPRVAAGAFSLPMLGALLLMGDSPSTGGPILWPGALRQDLRFHADADQRRDLGRGRGVRPRARHHRKLRSRLAGRTRALRNRRCNAADARARPAGVGRLSAQRTSTAPLAAKTACTPATTVRTTFAGNRAMYSSP